MKRMMGMNIGSNLEKGNMRLQLLLRALRSRNYRLFFTGQSISLVGTWMQQVAMSWLVYRLTGSAFLLGVVGFVGQIPTFLLAPVAGVLADRWDKRRLLIATQTLSMLQAAALAFFVLAGTVQVWQIVTLSLILGIISTFDIPTIVKTWGTRLPSIHPCSTPLGLSARLSPVFLSPRWEKESASSLTPSVTWR
jgi:MFS family permease